MNILASYRKVFNLNALSTSRWHWVDYLKGISILLVVYRHVLIGIERNGITVPTFLADANMIFYSFRMPLFFILSGMFIEWSLKKRSLNKVIWNKLETIIYPYLVWSFIQVTLQIILSGHTNSERGWVDYTYIIYQPQMLDQFWYLPALFNATFVFLLIKVKVSPPLWVHFGLSIVLYFTADYFERISMISDWMRFYFFFLLGNVLSKFIFEKEKQPLLKNYIPFLIIIPIFILAQYYYISNETNKIEFVFISLIGCLMMFFIAIRLEKLNAFFFLRVLGYHSLQIYVMHVMVAAFVRVMLTKLIGVQNPYLLLASGIFFGVVIPIIIYNTLIKENIGWFLFTPKKPMQKEYNKVENVVTT